MTRAQIIVASCSRRSLEIEQIKLFLKGNGYSLSTGDWTVDPSADLILLATCGFTEAAEDAAFAVLRRIQATKKPGAQVILGGCIPEINPERVAREFEGPTFSSQTYTNLDQALDAEHGFDQFKRPNTMGPRASQAALVRDGHRAIEILKSFDGSLSGLGYVSRRLGNGVRRKLIRSRYANLYDAGTFYIQIQEGCSMRCTYCVICKAIGPLRSKPIEIALDEFRAGLDAGFNRFQLMGDNAGSYGTDIDTTLADLLVQILALKGSFTLDLTDINPVYLPGILDPVKELLAQGRLATLYVPIQSRSRRLLKLMNRDCNMAAVEEMLIDIRQSSTKGLKLGTSLIVGFPSETLEDLEETIRFCQAVDFDWVWCHSFSTRPETLAAALPDQVPAGEILRRAQLVRAQLKGKSLVTTAEDTAGSRTCQG